MNPPLDDHDAQEIVVKVSLTTIYAKLLELDGLVRPIVPMQTDHEARLRMVERAQAFAAGRAGVVGAMAGALAAWLISKLGG